MEMKLTQSFHCFCKNQQNWAGMWMKTKISLVVNDRKLICWWHSRCMKSHFHWGEGTVHSSHFPESFHFSLVNVPTFLYLILVAMPEWLRNWCISLETASLLSRIPDVSIAVVDINFKRKMPRFRPGCHVLWGGRPPPSASGACLWHDALGLD